MLNMEQLTGLASRLDGRRVLSLYLDGREGDPAAHRAWRTVIAERAEGIAAVLRFAEGIA